MLDVSRNPDLILTLRSIVQGDLSAIMALERVCFPDPWPSSAFKDVVTDDDWYGLVAEHDGEIIAYACWLVTAGEGHLANIAVAPDYRRKSVARQLLARILEHVETAGCEIILLEVRPSNEAARVFYERHGFSVLYERPRYYQRPTENALVMGRSLIRTDREGDN